MQVERKMETFPVYFNLIPKPDKIITMGAGFSWISLVIIEEEKALKKIISPDTLTEQVTTIVRFILRTNDGLVRSLLLK